MMITFKNKAVSLEVSELAAFILLIMCVLPILSC